MAQNERYNRRTRVQRKDFNREVLSPINKENTIKRIQRKEENLIRKFLRSKAVEKVYEVAREEDEKS